MNVQILCLRDLTLKILRVCGLPLRCVLRFPEFRPKPVLLPESFCSPFGSAWAVSPGFLIRTICGYGVPLCGGSRGFPSGHNLLCSYYNNHFFPCQLKIRKHHTKSVVFSHPAPKEKLFLTVFDSMDRMGTTSPCRPGSLAPISRRKVVPFVGGEGVKCRPKSGPG